MNNTLSSIIQLFQAHIFSKPFSGDCWRLLRKILNFLPIPSNQSQKLRAGLWYSSNNHRSIKLKHLENVLKMQWFNKLSSIPKIWDFHNKLFMIAFKFILDLCYPLQKSPNNHNAIITSPCLINVCHLTVYFLGYVMMTHHWWGCFFNPDMNYQPENCSFDKRNGNYQYLINTSRFCCISYSKWIFIVSIATTSTTAN